MDYPKFYEIDGLLVVVTEEEGELIGRTLPAGTQYPAIKAINQGLEMNRDEFIEKMKEIVPASTLEAVSKYFKSGT